MNTDKIKKSIKEEISAEYVETFIKKLIDYMEVNNTFWMESNETGEIVSLANIKICRDVLHWVNENSKEFNFYEEFK